MYLDQSKEKTSLKTTIATLVALSLLNPHLYIDTCVLIGTLGSQFEGMERLNYTIGAVSASFIWFFTLSYGAALLIPIFQKTISWKILDFLIFATMLSIAGYLIIGIK